MIPQQLIARPQWVAWRTEVRDGKPTKVPYTPGTARPGWFKASATDPATWGSCAGSVAADLDGVGYVFSAGDPFTGIDLDDCFVDGALHPAAAALVSLFDSYTERSPSGGGLHIIIRAQFGGGRRARGAWGGKIEVYDRERYFTITGDSLEVTRATIEPRQLALDTVVSQLPARPWEANDPVPVPADLDDYIPLSDEEVLRQLVAEPRYAALWLGEWEQLGIGDGSQSDADWTLLRELAELTGGDRDRTEELFLESGLVRDKWTKRSDGYRPAVEGAVAAVWGSG